MREITKKEHQSALIVIAALAGAFTSKLIDWALSFDALLSILLITLIMMFLFFSVKWSVGSLLE